MQTKSPQRVVHALILGAWLLLCLTGQLSGCTSPANTESSAEATAPAEGSVERSQEAQPERATPDASEPGNEPAKPDASEPATKDEAENTDTSELSTTEGSIPDATPEGPGPDSTPETRREVAPEGTCQAGQSRPCYTGATGTQDKGECKAGTEQCTGGTWGPCTGEVTPTTESCNGKDDDCDGQIDEALPTPSCTLSCNNTSGTALCIEGKTVCQGPPEACNNKDDDCDGKVDEDCMRSQWVKQGGSNTNDVGYAIAQDSAGNTYITGSFTSINTDATFGTIKVKSPGGNSPGLFIAKLDATGAWKWVTVTGNTSATRGKGIAADAQGNVYVTGSFYGTLPLGSTTLTSYGDQDIFIAKLDTNGKWLWARHAGSSVVGADTGEDIALGPSGNLYVTGKFASNATFGTKTLQSTKALFVSKLDPSGAWLWTAYSDSKAQYDDVGNAITVDKNGAAYITGTIGLSTILGTFIPKTYGVFVAKIDDKGTWQWLAQPATKGATGLGIGLDSKNNVYVTGNFTRIMQFGSSQLIGTNQMFLARLNPQGAWQWAIQTKETKTGDRTLPTALHVDPNDQLYVTGQVSQSATFGSFKLNAATGTRGFITKVDTTGRWLSLTHISGSSSEANDLLIDAQDSIFVVGSFGSTASFGGTQLTAPKQTSLVTSDAFVWKLKQGP